MTTSVDILAPHNDTPSPEYVALGITPATWTWVATFITARDAKDYLWRLAGAGVPALVSRDPDGKRWHVTIRGGLAASPTAWLCSIRLMDDQPTCTGTGGGQHPLSKA